MTPPPLPHSTFLWPGGVNPPFAAAALGWVDPPSRRWGTWCTWLQLDARNLRFVYPFLLRVMYGVQVIFSEMSLPCGERTGGQVVLERLSRTEPTDKIEELTKALLQRGGTKSKGVAGLNAVMKRGDQGSTEIVRQVFQKAVDLGFCIAQGVPLNEYVGGSRRALSSPRACVACNA